MSRLLHPYDEASEVHPDFVFALWRFDLITDEQAAAAYREWDVALSEDARQRKQAEEEWNRQPWYTKFFGVPKVV